MSFSKTEMLVKPLLERWRAVARPKTPAPMMAIGSDLEVDTMVVRNGRFRSVVVGS